jgi:hypothetical protein
VTLHTEFITEALQRFREKHKTIAEKYFCSGIGLRLQGVDAAIAERVISKFAIEEALPILPIHDSFVVCLRDRKILEVVLVDAARDVIHRATGLAIEPLYKNIAGKYEETPRKDAFVTNDLNELLHYSNSEHEKRLQTWYKFRQATTAVTTTSLF